MQSLKHRLANIRRVQDEYFEHSANRGYLLWFMYEMLHEKIIVRYREQIFVNDVALLSGQEIQKQHNERLTEVVREWKPAVDKPKDNASDMKATYF
jgi:hypothetical protein